MGTTLAPWGSATPHVIQMGISSFFTNIYDNQLIVANNVYDEGLGPQKYLVNGGAAMYRQDTGAHYWYGAPTGSSGSVISWTSGMSLTQTGNLTVAGSITATGITSTSTIIAATNLSVGGNATITGTIGAFNLSGTNTGDQTLNSLLPSQVGNANKFLITDGSNAQWANVPVIYGVDGEDGLDGEMGIPGINGETGPTGPVGPTGETGPTGPTGPQGIPGLNGIQGEDGEDGVDGMPGPVGPAGIPGPQGIPGTDGATGPQGIPGLMGIPGTDGEDGDADLVIPFLSGSQRGGGVPECNLAVGPLGPNVLYSGVDTGTDNYWSPVSLSFWELTNCEQDWPSVAGQIISASASGAYITANTIAALPIYALMSMPDALTGLPSGQAFDTINFTSNPDTLALVTNTYNATDGSDTGNSGAIAICTGDINVGIGATGVSSGVIVMRTGISDITPTCPGAFFSNVGISIGTGVVNNGSGSSIEIIASNGSIEGGSIYLKPGLGGVGYDAGSVFLPGNVQINNYGSFIFNGVAGTPGQVLSSNGLSDHPVWIDMPRAVNGINGVDGVDGEDGEDGMPGPAGPTGATGATGPAGPAGPMGPGTITSITAGTGLSGGTITTSGTIALANTTVSAGSYTAANITVNAHGQITAASSSTPVLVAPKYQEFTATASQTVFNSTVNTVANASGVTSLLVFVNGVKQREGSAKAYTVTGANQITFNSGLLLNDDVELVAFA